MANKLNQGHYLCAIWYYDDQFHLVSEWRNQWWEVERCRRRLWVLAVKSYWNFQADLKEMGEKEDYLKFDFSNRVGKKTVQIEGDEN